MTPEDKIIYDIAINNGFTPNAALFVVAQARLESADYKSNVFKKNNNAFGMKYAGQPLATKGTRSPASEQISPPNANINFYAKFNSLEDSAKDTIGRLFNIKRNGVTPSMLKNASTPLEYAELQKKRGYFGGTAVNYAKLIISKLKKINATYTPPNKTAGLSPLLIIGLLFMLYTLKR
jgi:flagellum-specific peptidoglycan hydrolase FlgJ